MINADLMEIYSRVGAVSAKALNREGEEGLFKVMGQLGPVHRHLDRIEKNIFTFEQLKPEMRKVLDSTEAYWNARTN